MSDLENISGVAITVGHSDGVRPHKEPAVLKVLVDAKAAFVHQRVVLRAQQHQVVECGLSSVRPVLDMVAMQEALVSAARECTAVVVPGAHGPGYGLGDDA